MAKKLLIDLAAEKQGKLIEDGVYRVYKDELEEILERLRSGKDLFEGEWRDLSYAFFENIYKDFSEDVFKEAIRLKRKNKESAKDSALALIKLYKENR